MKNPLINLLLVFLFAILVGCATNKGESLNGIQANFPKGSTNGVANITTDTNGVIVATVTGAESVLIGGQGNVYLKSLFAITAFRGAQHNRTDMFGGNVQTSASDIETDPDDKAIGSAGTAIGNAISNAIQP